MKGEGWNTRATTVLKGNISSEAYLRRVRSLLRRSGSGSKEDSSSWTLRGRSGTPSSSALVLLTGRTREASLATAGAVVLVLFAVLALLAEVAGGSDTGAAFLWGLLSEARSGLGC